MFTGLVEEMGVVEKLVRGDKSLKLLVSKPSSFNDIKIGDSISVDGVCLTVADIDKYIVTFDVMQETLKRTDLENLKKDERVNLERGLKAGQRLGGHFVTGHIDYKAQIKNAQIKKNSGHFEVSMPKEYKKYIVPKGSVAIDGVSLTVSQVYKDSFSVYLIPHTLEKTTLGLKKSKDFVNIELDLLAKYVNPAPVRDGINKSKEEQKTSKINMGFLKEHGFI